MPKHTYADYMALRNHQPWIIENYLPVGGSLNIMGAYKRGKSFLVLQLAEALSRAAQPTWLGMPVLKKGPVFFLQMDTSRNSWQDRFMKLDGVLDLTHVDFSDKLDLPPMFDIRIADHFEQLRAVVQEGEAPAVTIVDVIRSFHQDNEAESAHMQKVLNLLQLATMPGALVIVSHTRKSPTDIRQKQAAEESMDENRGSNVINGWVDTMMKLTPSRLYIEARSAEASTIQLHQNRHGLWMNLKESASVADLLTSLGLKAQQAEVAIAARTLVKSHAPGTHVRELSDALRTLYPLLTTAQAKAAVKAVA